MHLRKMGVNLWMVNLIPMVVIGLYPRKRGHCVVQFPPYCRLPVTHIAHVDVQQIQHHTKGYSSHSEDMAYVRVLQCEGTRCQDCKDCHLEQPRLHPVGFISLQYLCVGGKLLLYRNG